jgi:hypothetical protein
MQLTKKHLNAIQQASALVAQASELLADAFDGYEEDLLDAVPDEGSKSIKVECKGPHEGVYIYNDGIAINLRIDQKFACYDKALSFIIK